MTSRWGSCNLQKHISLNSALVYLPQNLIEYVIIHELCHIKFLNHSHKFWKLVENYIPNYSKLEQELKQYKINFIID